MTINGIYWRILLVSANHPMLMDGDRWTLGCCDDYTKTIYIYEELPNYKLYKVLAHEIAHAAMFSYGVELSYNQEEMVADLIATYGREIICQANRWFKRLKE